MSEVTERSWELSPYEASREAQGVIKTSTNIAVSSKVSNHCVLVRMGCDGVYIPVFVPRAEVSDMFGSAHGDHDYRGVSAQVL